MKNNTSVQKAAIYLRQEISNHNLKPGMHLKEAEIASKVGVSRVPVREAFRILQSEGYIEVIPNRGCFVKKISTDYIREAAVVYSAISPWILKAAIPKYNEKTFKKAEAILTKIEKCKDFSQIGYLFWDFAKVILSPSKMKYPLSIVDDLYRHNIRLLNGLLQSGANYKYDTTTHRSFLELCRQKKSEEAIALWGRHIEKVRDVMLNKNK